MFSKYFNVLNNRDYSEYSELGLDIRYYWSGASEASYNNWRDLLNLW